MKNNWNRAVNDINRRRFAIPDGWDTKERVAESLQCSPDRVADLLKPGLQVGQIERQDFPVWDENRRLTVKVTCYREIINPTSKLVPDEDAGETMEFLRVKRALLKDANRLDYTIARNTRVSVSFVASVRKKLLDNPT